jgi:hypothetical protein
VLAKLQTFVYIYMFVNCCVLLQVYTVATTAKAMCNYCGRSRDGSVGIVYLWAGQLGFESWPGEVFLYSTASRPSLRSTQHPTQLVLRVLSACIKWPGREGDHSPPSSAEVSTGGAIPPPPIHFYVINHRNKFYL